METIERTGKTSWIYNAFEANNFSGMTIQEINDITKIPTGDIEFFFEKHCLNSQKEDKYVCKNKLYYLLAECR